MENVTGLFILQEEDMVDLATGCGCCTSRAELVKRVKELAAGGVEHVLLLSYALADPVEVSLFTIDMPTL